MIVRHRSHRAGFTLIEIVLATSLALSLFGTAIWFYQYAGSVRDNVSYDMQQIVTRRQVMDRITSDLRGAVATAGGTTLDGSADRMTFITARLPGKAMWAAQNITDEPLPPDPDLQRVSYGLTIVESDTGERIVVGIDTQVQKLITAQVVEENKGIQTTLLSQEIRFIRFQYWDGTAWQIEWKDQPVLPLAVEVVIGYEPMEEGGDPLQYAEQTWRRVIFVPSGQPVQQGTVIRGLSTGGGQ